MRNIKHKKFWNFTFNYKNHHYHHCLEMKFIFFSHTTSTLFDGEWRKERLQIDESNVTNTFWFQIARGVHIPWLPSRLRSQKAHVRFFCYVNCHVKPLFSLLRYICLVVYICDIRICLQTACECLCFTIFHWLLVQLNRLCHRLYRYIIIFFFICFPHIRK